MHGLGEALGKGIEALAVFAILSIFLAWPLAIWKIIDICIWIFS